MTTISQKHTPGEWRLGTDAQGPCMVLHPTRDGVAIASLTNTFTPTNGFHDDWDVFTEDGKYDSKATQARINERNANAFLIAAAPELLASILNSDDAHWTPAMRAAVAKATCT